MQPRSATTIIPMEYGMLHLIRFSLSKDVLKNYDYKFEISQGWLLPKPGKHFSFISIVARRLHVQ